MDDLYARAFGWNPHRSQKDAFYRPIYPQYDDYGVLVPFAKRVPAVTKKVLTYPCNSEGDTESDSAIDPWKMVSKAEKAAEAKVKATAEYEKAKVKVDEAKNALEECEAKLKKASKDLARYASRLEERRNILQFY